MHEIKASRSINVTEKGTHWNLYNNALFQLQCLGVFFGPSQL
uniref:Uncharacterized protein n=1 Tax=Anguilla anguilla TaxID=7936 RepID=A0A0E9RM89_ANGAN